MAENSRLGDLKLTNHAISPRSASASFSTKLNGIVSVPGDKSISHRALIIGSQVKGSIIIKGLLEAEDIMATKNALQAMGVSIKKKLNSTWKVGGVGVGGLLAPDNIIDMGNTGTGVRLLMGLVASYPFVTSFTGDQSLKSRPMARIVDPLKSMGVTVEKQQEGCKLPISLKGNPNLANLFFESKIASAQVKSAILLAGLNSTGKTVVIENHATRDHTEKMLKGLGANIVTDNLEDGKVKITLEGRPELHAKIIEVPGDPSSAAFLVVAALIVPESKVIVKNVCINPHRIGLYITLKEMGANIEFINLRVVSGEDVADIKVSYSQLTGVTVPQERAPSMIDEYPILSVAAAVAKGKTIMRGLAELRVKESNRLDVTANSLVECGVYAKVEGDDLVVVGNVCVAGGVKIKTHMDHRIAMTFLVLGLVAENPIKVDDVNMIDTSFPNFIKLMKKMNANIKLA